MEVSSKSYQPQRPQRVCQHHHSFSLPLTEPSRWKIISWTSTSINNKPTWFLVVSMDLTASRAAFSSELQACVLADRGTQQAHTNGGMPELLLKSPASSPQDYRCQQNSTSNRTYYDIGTTGTCGSEGVSQWGNKCKENSLWKCWEPKALYLCWQ